MKLIFDDIYSREKGKAGFVIGLAGSVNEHKRTLIKMSKDKENYVFLSCNNFDNMIAIDCDYWVFANSMLTVEKMYQRMNKTNAVIVYADSVDLTSKRKVDTLLTNDYLPYDQRHVNGQSCLDFAGCCKNVKKDRLTIQEYLQKITGYKEYFKNGYTVATSMLAFSVILGCNPIYIFGVDLTYNNAYIDGSKTRDIFGVKDLKNNTNFILNDFHIINESAKKLGIKIFNTDTDSLLLQVFETLNFA